MVLPGTPHTPAPPMSNIRERYPPTRMLCISLVLACAISVPDTAYRAHSLMAQNTVVDLWVCVMSGTDTVYAAMRCPAPLDHAGTTDPILTAYVRAMRGIALRPPYAVRGTATPTLLRLRYAMSGTDTCYAMSGTDVPSGGICLRARYARSGADRAYAPTTRLWSSYRCRFVSPYAPLTPCSVLALRFGFYLPLRTRYAMSGTDLAYRMRMCPVLTECTEQLSDEKFGIPMDRVVQVLAPILSSYTRAMGCPSPYAISGTFAYNTKLYLAMQMPGTS
eukprot:627376-Rhodomonas_salina.3